MGRPRGSRNRRRRSKAITVDSPVVRKKGRPRGSRNRRSRLQKAVIEEKKSKSRPKKKKSSSSRPSRGSSQDKQKITSAEYADVVNYPEVFTIGMYADRIAGGELKSKNPGVVLWCLENNRPVSMKRLQFAKQVLTKEYNELKAGINKKGWFDPKERMEILPGEIKDLNKAIQKQTSQSPVMKYVKKSKKKSKSSSRSYIPLANQYKPERGCTRQTSKKYTSRPSPAYPANLCRGERKIGNDGNMYESKKMGNAFRWTRVRTK